MFRQLTTLSRPWSDSSVRDDGGQRGSCRAAHLHSREQMRDTDCRPFVAFALSRMIRWMAFYNRGAARRSLQTLLALPFEHLIVGHGAPIRSNGREALAAAYDWLSVQQR